MYRHLDDGRRYDMAQQAGFGADLALHLVQTDNMDRMLSHTVSNNRYGHRLLSHAMLNSRYVHRVLGTVSNR